MSGSNPFRPKKSEDFTAHQCQHHSSQSTSSLSVAPDPIFLGHPPRAALAASQTNDPSAPRALATTPPPPINDPDLDDSVTSDDRSTLDPFNRDSDVSDDGAERVQTPSEAPVTTSPGDLRRPRGNIRITPPSVSSSNQFPTTTTLPEDQSLRTDNQRYIDSNEELPEHPAVANSFELSQSDVSSDEIDSDSTADELHTHAPYKTSARPTSLGPGIGLRALASRSGNRDRVPPPPPKSHHGKMIIPDLSRTPPASQTTPSKAANRVSFHGSSSSPLASPRVLQMGPDYFSSSSSQPAPPTDILRRSQSQYKRPPTPPLSRRHSQMRRSKSTFSKSSPSQLSIPSARIQTTASTPSSPGSRSLTPIRSGDSRFDSSIPDEASSISTVHSENIAPTSSTQTLEVSGLGIQSNPRSKRASMINQLPPPPPPRRTRGSNHSNDSNRPASLCSEQRADGVESFVPHPSNAKDILADLSRLQKEVDDLRGHYQGRND
ncbi:hypothetical protein BDW59DRAFT_21475 [Aspergillus cavernicola]|uniref:Uncharacterized protein n=1 Tax=Aspergillus cavernicola TaxID=176166 RepID=A0ABR4HFZ3_9EURO